MKNQIRKKITNIIFTETKEWGNSLALRIPKEIRENLHLIDGSKVSISFNEKSKELIIKKAKPEKLDFAEIFNDVDLKSLTKKITKKNKHNGEFLDEVVGKEIW